RPPRRRRLLVGERPRVPLVAVDDDLELTHPRGPRGGEVDRGAGLLRRPGRLPEDRLPPAPHPGEDELRAVLPAAVQHEVDRRAPPHTRAHRHPFDDLRLPGPAHRPVAVDLPGPWPRLARL